MRIRILLPVAAIGVITSVAMYATQVTSTSTRHVVQAPYTTTEAVVPAILALVFVRRSNPMWMLILPIIGGIAVGVCFVIAGHRADHAAISVETTKAEPMSIEIHSRATSSAYACNRRAERAEAHPQLIVVQLRQLGSGR